VPVTAKNDEKPGLKRPPPLEKSLKTAVYLARTAGQMEMFLAIAELRPPRLTDQRFATLCARSKMLPPRRRRAFIKTVLWLPEQHGEINDAELARLSRQLLTSRRFAAAIG